ncbi:FxsA family protein [Acinetobacter indicus]|uniref:FxsA family protein n=1 Tax=Acinetobacter indicus TaxID=756892 RepID=A0A6C0Y2I5_9GAMM|nr:FxsA family protein [Acinetobacter indicus]MCO8087887.1 FxsA family protein [Acinetobacter indicus]MCO8099511.1 FxsA family protein [Acinetobacter indicus]MCO8105115.1 FxsA family protein [Acinetobacter indicus]MCO8110789.1 FxsA family protein [Acinetobacter indicus]MDM1268888.1 FxsA family protein [Acinetobacter indicus]
MKLFLIILAGLILEVFVWIGVGDLVGSMWYVFFWFIAAFFIGMNLIRKYSAGIMPQMQQMQMGQMSADPALSNNLPKIFAGFLLLIPGLITDVLAVLIMIPGVQNAFKAAMMKAMMKRQQAMMNQMMGGMMGDMNGMGGGAQGQNPFADLMRQMQDMQNQQAGRDSSIIDGEAREVTPEAKKIEMKDVNKH